MLPLKMRPISIAKGPILNVESLSKPEKIEITVKYIRPKVYKFRFVQSLCGI